MPSIFRGFFNGSVDLDFIIGKQHAGYLGTCIYALREPVFWVSGGQCRYEPDTCLLRVLVDLLWLP